LLKVLENLLDNAIKFSPPASDVTVEASQQDDCVLAKVSDRGIGIAPDRLERIFDRFYQVDASDARPVGGAGLGLALCDRIMQVHSGRIWAESTVGEGSQFFLTLPLI
jgi:signal transduction histidine kinase